MTRHPAEAVAEPRNRTERRHGVPPMAHSVDDSCALLGISKPTLYGLIAEGRLRSVMVGRRRLIPTSELERLLSDNS